MKIQKCFKQKFSANRKKRGAAQLTEFGVALLLFVSLFLLPSLFIVRLTIAVALGQFATDKASQVAASAAAYDVALSKSQKLFDSTLTGTLGAIACLAPTDGAFGTGVDLYVSIEDSKKKREMFGPNRVMVRDVDLIHKRYFYTAVTHIKLAVLPGADSHSPILGFLANAMILNFRASHVCENPESLKTVAGVPVSSPLKSVQSEKKHES